MSNINLDDSAKSSMPFLGDLEHMKLPIRIFESSIACERRLFNHRLLNPQVDFHLAFGMGRAYDGDNDIYYVNGNIYTPYCGDPFVWADAVYRCNNPPKTIKTAGKLWSMRNFLYEASYEDFISGAGGDILKLNGICYFFRTAGKFKATILGRGFSD